MSSIRLMGKCQVHPNIYDLFTPALVMPNTEPWVAFPKETYLD